jgi:hypothetical protein
MPLVAAKLKAAMKARLLQSFQSQFQGDQADNKTASASWEKMATAISEIAEDIVLALQTDAEILPGIAVTVNPGIPTAGSPASQVTVGPGTGMTTAPAKIT